MQSRILAALAACLLPAGASAQTVTANDPVVRAGTATSADWTAPEGHSTTDWISLYGVADANTEYGRYTNPSFVYTGAPLSGTALFTLDRSTPPGAYEYRYLLNNGYVDAATGPVTVIGPCEGTNFALEATPVVLAGQDVEVSWALTGGAPEICAQSFDWVAMWPEGAPDTAAGYVGTSPVFVYTNDQTAGSQTFTVSGSTPPGNYEFRYIEEGGSSSSGVSNPVTVLEPCAGTTWALTVTPDFVEPDGEITVDWTVTTPNPGSCVSGNDWIAFYAQGAGNGSYGNTVPVFIYTGGALTGQQLFTLTGPPPGTYEFRYLRSGTVTAATSDPVEVVAPAAVPALGPWAGVALGLGLLAAGWRRLASRRA